MRAMPVHPRSAEVTVRCDPCTRRRGHLRTIPAMVVLSRQPIPGEPGRHLWMVRPVDRLVATHGAPMLPGVRSGTLYGRGGGVELHCRACGHRPRKRLRDLYADADLALAEGRAEIYV